MSKGVTTLVQEQLSKFVGLIRAKRTLKMQDAKTLPVAEALRIDAGIDDINRALADALEEILVAAGMIPAAPVIQEDADGD